MLIYIAYRTYMRYKNSNGIFMYHSLTLVCTQLYVQYTYNIYTIYTYIDILLWYIYTYSRLFIVKLITFCLMVVLLLLVLPHSISPPAAITVVSPLLT